MSKAAGRTVAGTKATISVVSGSGAGTIAVAVAVIVAVLCCCGMYALSSQGSQAQALSGGSGVDGLDLSKVPVEFQFWVLQAGSICPEFSPAYVAAQLKQESGFNPRAQSPVGAQGISQFMPGTWASWGKDVNGNGTSVWDPPDAIMAQGHLDCANAEQVRRWIGDGVVAGPPPGTNPVAWTRDRALAGYNAGMGRVEQYGHAPDNGIPPFTETKNYVRLINDLAITFAAPAAGSPGARAVKAAQTRMGWPYHYGGDCSTGPVGCDCSSLMQIAWRAAGRDIGRTTDEQINAGTRVFDVNELQVGALVFPNAGHVGMYMGEVDGVPMVIRAPQTGGVVGIMRLQDFYQGVPYALVNIP